MWIGEHNRAQALPFTARGGTFAWRYRLTSAVYGEHDVLGSQIVLERTREIPSDAAIKLSTQDHSANHLPRPSDAAVVRS
jgi:hypothetical protein